MSNEFEEILNEKLLRELTRAFIDFFESILIEKPKTNPNGIIIVVVIIASAAVVVIINNSSLYFIIRW